MRLLCRSPPDHRSPSASPSRRGEYGGEAGSDSPGVCMRMPDLPKHLKRLLREHVALAHEEELRRALLPLADDFERWRRGEVSSGELSERIHEFHQGPAREIWKAYNYGSPALSVAYAIHSGILRREQVPAELLEILGPSLESLEQQEGSQVDEAPEEE